MRVTIHQPEFASWLGFFQKASLVDTFILLDDVQFRKNYFQNRNRVRTSNGWTWITVPVERFGHSTRINEVRIALTSNPRWTQKIETTVHHAYGRAPHFESVFSEFTHYLRKTNHSLVDLNIALIRWMLKGFGVQCKVLLSSSFESNATGSQRILELCLAVGADTYVSGVSGRDYLDLDAFKRSEITVEFQEFYHPVYKQLHPGFVPLISALEGLFLFGPSSNQLLQLDWPDRLETVFT